MPVEYAGWTLDRATLAEFEYVSETGNWSVYAVKQGDNWIGALIDNTLPESDEADYVFVWEFERTREILADCADWRDSHATFDPGNPKSGPMAPDN